MTLHIFHKWEHITSRKRRCMKCFVYQFKGYTTGKWKTES